MLLLDFQGGSGILQSATFRIKPGPVELRRNVVIPIMNYDGSPSCDPYEVPETALGDFVCNTIEPSQTPRGGDDGIITTLVEIRKLQSLSR